MSFKKAIFSIIPYSFIRFSGRLIAYLAYLFMGKRKRIAKANLDLVFQKRLTEKEKDYILKENLSKICIGFLWLIKCLYSTDICKKDIEIIGEENLEEAFAKKRGVVAVSAHIGNFPLMTTLLAKRGYPVAVIAKDPHNPILARLIQILKKKSGINFIDATDKHAPYLALRWLRQGGVLYLQLDQNAPKHKAMIDFFGYPVPTYKSPVVLSKKTGAPILPMFITSKSDHQTIHIEEPFRLEITGKKEKDIYNNLTSLMKILESYILKYPTQWWWWHRRFKEHIDYSKL